MKIKGVSLKMEPKSGDKMTYATMLQKTIGLQAIRKII